MLAPIIIQLYKQFNVSVTSYKNDKYVFATNKICYPSYSCISKQPAFGKPSPKTHLSILFIDSNSIVLAESRKNRENNYQEYFMNDIFFI